MKKFFLLFFALVTAAVAQVTVPWTDVDKTGSSLADFTTRSAGDLNSGTLPDGRFPATLPALSGLNLTALNASNIASGTLNVARLPALTGGDATTSAGSGTITFATTGVGAGTYRSVTVDTKGRVTAGTNPTTVSGYGITDVYTVTQADARRNALSTRGAVAFDGTNYSKAISTLTGPAIGTEDFSFSLTFRVPLANPAGYLGLATITDNSASWVTNYLAIVTNGALVWNFANVEALQISGFVSSYAGEVVNVVGVRSGTTAKLYVNHVLAGTLNGSGSGVGVSIQSTFFILGYITSSESFNGPIYTATLYNTALSQADVTEVFKLGGGVPERFKWASQDSYPTGGAQKLGTADGTTTTASDGAGGGGISRTAVAGARNGGSGAYVERYTANGTGAFASEVGIFAGFPDGNTPLMSVRAPVNTIGQQVRLRGWSKANSGTFTFYINGATVPSAGSWTQFDITVSISKNYRGTPSLSYSFSGGSQVSGDSLDFDDVQVQPLGALLHLDGDRDGVGYQWHDDSANWFDANLTITGTSWTNPKTSGFIRANLTWSGTHEAKSLLGQRCLPDGAFITHATVKSTTASSGSGLVLSSNATSGYFAALQTFTTAKKLLSLANSGIPASTSDTDNTINLDPDTAAFTGSVRVGVRYSMSPGTP